MLVRDQLMKFHVFVCALLFTASCFGRTIAADDHSVIEYAKSLNVARLDRALPTQHLEAWLLFGPARLEETRWYIGAGCDLIAKRPEPSDGYPLCVRIAFSRGTLSGWALVRVGTTRKGVHGRPRFEYASMTTEKLVRTGQFKSTRRLSQFVSLMTDVYNADKQEPARRQNEIRPIE
jgi:hypothetical protein